MKPDYQTSHMSHLQQASISRFILGIRLSSTQRQTRVFKQVLKTIVLTVMLVLISSASVVYALTEATVVVCPRATLLAPNPYSVETRIYKAVIPPHLPVE
jgi:hypothetical protein